jgi:hypothetical protein
VDTTEAGEGGTKDEKDNATLVVIGAALLLAADSALILPPASGAEAGVSDMVAEASELLNKPLPAKDSSARYAWSSRRFERVSSLAVTCRTRQADSHRRYIYIYKHHQKIIKQAQNFSVKKHIYM